MKALKRLPEPSSDHVMSRTLITIGLILIVIGLLWPLLEKSGLGRLPGDISVEKENVRFYFPITTSIIISIILTLIIWFFRK
jgi:hypothetical protein